MISEKHNCAKIATIINELIHFRKRKNSEKMQEVCNTIDSQIKSEGASAIQCIPNIGPPPPNPTTVMAKLSPEKQHADSSYWMPTESGFINSQPSMAEFLTHVEPESPGKLGHPGYPTTPIDNCDSVPEYPWMKEKKTSRKNSAQGEFGDATGSLLGATKVLS